jgi:secreted PhoX family phosphatase
VRRREFIGGALGSVAALAFGGALRHGGGSAGYGPLAAPDANGIRLPAGFRSRVVARGGRPVPGTGYRWHPAPDGAACFPASDGGWILVSNSETLEGGASAIRFRPDGRVADAYRILAGTMQNCSGGATPWGTWLSCEEIEDGRVWECDPDGRRDALVRPAMGVFKHEAAAVDAAGRKVYLTEDLMDGRLYRFTPDRWPDLAAGTLEVATVVPGGTLRWTRVPDPAARRTPCRRQVPASTPFKRAEGIWIEDGVLYLATTGDSRIHAYDMRGGRVEVVYDGLAARDAPLIRVDQLTASPAGELFVCEDLATEEIHVGVLARSGEVSRFLAVTGREHDGSELTGVAFDPSGRRMYLASQRAAGAGAVYEITGSFRRAA